MSSEKISADALNKALLSELARGVQKTFENAEELFKEACLLKKNWSSEPRAFSTSDFAGGMCKDRNFRRLRNEFAHGQQGESKEIEIRSLKP